MAKRTILGNIANSADAGQKIPSVYCDATMNNFARLQILALLAGLASLACAQEAKPEPATPTRPATTIYRQVLADGRIVYSDESLAGARVDQTIRVAPPIEGNLWSTEPGVRPVMPGQTVRTPVQRMPSAPLIPTARTPRTAINDALQMEVMRAEMLLEDAKKRQADGAGPLPFELRDNSDGGPATNLAYASRQKRLARDVAYAEEELRKALQARDKHH